MNDKEALKLALEALKESQTDNDTMEFWDRKTKAITACEKALASPVQEPVATVQCINGITIGYLDVMQPVGTKLYTTPPQNHV
jgi:hypothetical protein